MMFYFYIFNWVWLATHHAFVQEVWRFYRSTDLVELLEYCVCLFVACMPQVFIFRKAEKPFPKVGNQCSMRS